MRGFRVAPPSARIDRKAEVAEHAADYFGGRSP
jgi:hypothetical protein